MPALDELVSEPWQLALLLSVPALLLLLLIYRVVRRRRSSLQTVLDAIGLDRIEGLVIPSADEGEIQLDYVLLTMRGLLVLDIKDVEGKVFGGDKMQDWTVISAERRFTFPNPQPALYDRIAAVRQIVRQIPVDGRLLFLDGAEFTKGVPSMVCSVAELANDYGGHDARDRGPQLEAFKPQWDALRGAHAAGTA